MVPLKLVEFTTCKLIFDHGTTKEVVTTVIEKYTRDFKIANHYPDHTVGCNRIAFTVVDLPMEAMRQLFNDGMVKDIDLMASFSKKPSDAECCGGGGCGGGSP
jgi:hypothetical protein